MAARVSSASTCCAALSPAPPAPHRAAACAPRAVARCAPRASLARLPRAAPPALARRLGRARFLHVAPASSHTGVPSGGPGEPQPPPPRPHVPPAAPPLGRTPRDAPPEAPPRALERPFVRGETLQLAIKGVSFDDRQAAVAALAPGDPVVFVREPENAFDENAVAIIKPIGTPLGYVPRAMTAVLRDDAAPGRVASAGVNAAGVAWAVVAIKPAGPGLAAELPPAPGAPRPLDAVLRPELWARLAATAAAAAHGRCVGCGDAAPQLQVLPAWRFDPRTRVATLRGLVPLCVPCAAARSLEEGEAALERLRAVNGWTQEEAEAHAAWAQAERARRGALGPWTADAAWLAAQEGTTPDDVAAAESVMLGQVY